MSNIISNDLFKIWLDQQETIKGVKLPTDLELAAAVLWFEHVGIFIIPERNINGWTCKIEDIGLIPMSNYNSFPIKKTRSEAITHAIEIAQSLLR